MEGVHVKARQSPYPGNRDIQRFPVDARQVPWNSHYSEYKPTEYTASVVLDNPPWADNRDANQIKRFNELDGKIDRTSLIGHYEVEKSTNRPLNPRGRTGLTGRGLLGRWGPNHAGDPVVTRWAKSEGGEKKKVLEIILVTRKDNGELALPGGMVDAGEHVSVATKREFIEEATNSNPDGASLINELFKNSVSIYEGYIDDPRNTDNAWMESQAVNMHDESGNLTKDLKLEAGDDAAKVKWFSLDRDLKLYASHELIIRKVIEKHQAYQYWNDNSK